MTDMKCPSCGGTDFVPYQFAEYVISEFKPHVDSFVCVNCGRVEFYARESDLKATVVNFKAKQEREAKLAEEKARAEEKIRGYKKELEGLKAIVNDENQTVKTVKEAQARIIEIEKELEGLGAKKSARLWDRYYA